jgi:hypothetical protein
VTNKELITIQDYYDAIMEGTDECGIPEGWEEFAQDIIELTLMLHKKQLRKDFRHVSLY